MNAVVRFALVLMVTAISAARVGAEEPRKNDGWTEPWKLMSVECVLYIGTVADRITTEWKFVPYQAMGLFAVGNALLMAGIYAGARLEDRDIRAFRRLRAAIRAAARRQLTAIRWTKFDPVRTRCLFWLFGVATLVFYFLWLIEASETRVDPVNTVRIKSAPRLIADWWWVCFWSFLIVAIVQGFRWYRVSTEEALKRDLNAEQEARVLAEENI